MLRTPPNKTLRVFIASPDDVTEERELVSLVIDELRRTMSPILRIELEAVRWETHSWPAIGEDVQDVINQQIADYDVFVGIMWRRFGTPTKRDGSGTGEEFHRAFNYFRQFQRPKIMFYFRTKPFYPVERAELKQFERVFRFRAELRKLGVLFWEYNEPLEFERRFREHLTKQLFHAQNRLGDLAQNGSPSVFFSYKRQDQERVESFYQALKSSGRFEPWMDVHDILPGGSWVAECTSAIEAADFFLTFISEHSVNPQSRSETGFTVRSELEIAEASATDRGLENLPPGPQTYIIPVRLDPVQPSGVIASYQWIDLFDEAAHRKLLDALDRIWEGRRQLR